jgi:hypothetical protein
MTPHQLAHLFWDAAKCGLTWPALPVPLGALDEGQREALAEALREAVLSGRVGRIDLAGVVAGPGSGDLPPPLPRRIHPVQIVQGVVQQPDDLLAQRPHVTLRFLVQSLSQRLRHPNTYHHGVSHASSLPRVKALLALVS